MIGIFIKSTCAVFSFFLLQYPANAQTSAWTKWGKSVSVCDNKALKIRLFGVYAGKRDAPDATQDYESQESPAFVLQLAWEGPGAPRLVNGEFGLVGTTSAAEEAAMTLAVSSIVSVDGARIPGEPDAGLEWQVAESSKKAFYQRLAKGQSANIQFLDRSNRVVLTRSFDLAKARQAASNLQQIQWRCP